MPDINVWEPALAKERNGSSMACTEDSADNALKIPHVDSCMAIVVFVKGIGAIASHISCCDEKDNTIDYNRAAIHGSQQIKQEIEKRCKGKADITGIAYIGPSDWTQSYAKTGGGLFISKQKTPIGHMNKILCDGYTKYIPFDYHPTDKHIEGVDVTVTTTTYAITPYKHTPYSCDKKSEKEDTTTTSTHSALGAGGGAGACSLK